MRAQVTATEYELRCLQSKWAKHIPDARTRVMAQRCALEKYAAKQSNEEHRELKELYQKHQFLLASLQTAVLRNTLQSSGSDILKELHFDAARPRPKQRKRMLIEHNRRSSATVPSIVEKFSQMAIDAKQKETGKAMLPLSQISVTGCADCTLVSSVFVSEIPHPSLEEVFAAARSYFETFPAMIKHHFGAEASVETLDRVNAPVTYARLNYDGATNRQLPASVNHVGCFELTPNYGMIFMDAITEDALYPVPSTNALQYGMCALTVTPLRDPSIGKTVSVRLRWVVLYRYKLSPSDPALKNDLETNRPIFNGDLITSAICSYLQGQQSQR